LTQDCLRILPIRIEFVLVLLDRDGVINEDSPNYVRDASQWTPLAGSLQAIARLSRAGRTIAVCSNQAGVSKGALTVADLEAINRAMTSAVTQAGGRIDGVFYCTHSPEQRCACRKPAPGLLLQAMTALGASAAETTFIGDSLRDAEAAIAAGCAPILVRTGHGSRSEAQARAIGVDLVFDDLAAATNWLLREC
jgi:D-glycero-D-manno-heptose 1,7-bisphosphate phosphatase